MEISLYKYWPFFSSEELSKNKNQDNSQGQNGMKDGGYMEEFGINLYLRSQLKCFPWTAHHN